MRALRILGQNGLNERRQAFRARTAKTIASNLVLLSIWLLAVALLGSGCSSSRKNGPRPSSLSDAVRQIEDDDDRKRPLVVRDEDEDEDEDDDDHSIFVTVIDVDDDDDDWDETELSCEDHHDKPSWNPDVRFVFGGSVLGGGSDRQIETEFSGGSIHLGAEVDSRWRGDLELAYRSLEPHEYASFDPLLDQEEWHIGGNLRYYFTPPSRNVRVYTLLGFSLGELHWNYREPVEVISVDDWGYVTGRRWLHQDRLTTGSIYLGGGLSFLRTRHVEVGANVRAGYQFYDDYTRSGLHNDLFSPHGYAAVALELSFLPGN
jgi:hypothetical protein